MLVFLLEGQKFNVKEYRIFSFPTVLFESYLHILQPKRTQRPLVSARLNGLGSHDKLQETALTFLLSV